MLNFLPARLFESKSLRSLVEFLDLAHNLLDEIWRLPFNYPQNRMKDIMDIISAIIIETCSENLNNEDIFNIESFHITEILNEVTEYIESWLHVCDTLTRLFWPNNASHSWIGEPHVPAQAIGFQERLSEIKSIKNMYKQIVSLFSDNGHMVQSVKMMFAPFKGEWS